ncbi:MAG TPA: hypothetical protein VF909_06945, partial [Roseiflexaceae bacterium]
YAATLATMYPDQVPDGEAKGKRRGDAETRRSGDKETGVQASKAGGQEEETTETNGRAPAPPRDSAEAERRFFARYGETIGGENWAAVQRYLQSRAPKPTTVEGWIAAAEAVRDQARHDAPAAMTA